MNIVVDFNCPIQDGTEVKFRSPVDCSQVTGLIVNYNGGSQEFAFADAHGNNVGDIDHLFAEDVVVKVILDVTKGMAFVQNADTNAYIESTFVKTVNGTKPDKNGNVEVAGGGGVEINDDEISTDKTWSSQKISDTIAEQGGGGGGGITEEDFYNLLYTELEWALNTTSDGGGFKDIIAENVIEYLPIYEGGIR